jgi:hypothetical protein
MAVLKSYGREVRSIFQLLGDKENDITSSICWALVKCPQFLKEIVKKVCGVDADPEDVAAMKANRVLVLPEGADARWITKNANDAQVENILHPSPLIFRPPYAHGNTLPYL